VLRFSFWRGVHNIEVNRIREVPVLELFHVREVSILERYAY
jgi:hypothetical protein